MLRNLTELDESSLRSTEFFEISFNVVLMLKSVSRNRGTIHRKLILRKKNISLNIKFS